MSPAAETDAAEVAQIVMAVETSLHGDTTYSQGDLEREWSVLELEQNTRVVRDGDRVVAYGTLRDLGERWRAEACVHPEARGRGIGRLIATELEAHAVAGGARRLQSSVFEPDTAAHELLEALGYRAVRVFREMRIDLDAPPDPPRWPDGLRVVPFDAERDARAFHAASQEAFADHWDYTPGEFDAWLKEHIETERYDPALVCAVHAGDEIAAGTFSAGDTYGGGFIHVVFTRRPWRRRGVGAALLADAFRRLWDAGERSIGLGVDAESGTGAFRLYERAGMTPALGWVMYEKAL